MGDRAGPGSGATHRLPKVPDPPLWGAKEAQAGQGAQGAQRAAHLPDPGQGSRAGTSAPAGRGCPSAGDAGSGPHRPAPHLLLVQGVVLQPIHLQELLGHPDAGQVCEYAEVAGHPKTCRGRGRGNVDGVGTEDKQNLGVSPREQRPVAAESQETGLSPSLSLEVALCPGSAGIRLGGGRLLARPCQLRSPLSRFTPPHTASPSVSGTFCPLLPLGATVRSLGPSPHNSPNTLGSCQALTAVLGVPHSCSGWHVSTLWLPAQGLESPVLCLLLHPQVRL